VKILSRASSYPNREIIVPRGSQFGVFYHRSLLLPPTSRGVDSSRQIRGYTSWIHCLKTTDSTSSLFFLSQTIRSFPDLNSSFRKSTNRNPTQRGHRLEHNILKEQTSGTQEIGNLGDNADSLFVVNTKAYSLASVDKEPDNTSTYTREAIVCGSISSQFGEL
jgi:hypothetical protein